MTDDTGGTQKSCQPTKQGKKWPVALAEKHPHDLTHRWVSFMGTGRDFLGQPISYRHGRPNETLMLFRKPFDDHVDSLDDADKLELHRVLTSGRTEEIEARLEVVRERFFEPFGEPRPQEGP